MNNDILTILTSEDKDDIRKALKDIIVNRIKEDFQDYDSYIFDGDSLGEIIEEAIEEVKDEIKPLLKEQMFNEMKKKLGMD
jgi:ribosomal protein S3AE